MEFAKLRLGLVVLTLIVSCLVGTAKTTFAACSGSGCNNKDPNTEGCSTGAITANSATGSSGGYTLQVELRYSSSCNSNWNRVTRLNSSTSTWLDAHLVASSGSTGKYIFGTSGWSSMWDGTGTVCADGKAGASSSSGPYAVSVSGVCG